MHDQTALRTDGIDHLLEQFPDVRAEMDAGYRGLHRDHPAQVSVPPKKPAKDAAPEAIAAWEQARHAQSSARICVEHAIAGSKHWRPLQRWIGRVKTCQRQSGPSARWCPTAPPPGNTALPPVTQRPGEGRPEPNCAPRRNCVVTMSLLSRMVARQ